MAATQLLIKYQGKYICSKTKHKIDAIYEIITDERMAKYIKFPNLTKEEELECIKTWIKEAD